jgi:hypothetical protein
MTSRPLLDTIEEEDVVLLSTPSTPKGKGVSWDDNGEHANSDSNPRIQLPAALSKQKKIAEKSPSTPVNMLPNVPSAAQRFSNRYDSMSPSSPASRFQSNPNWSISSPSSPRKTNLIPLPTSQQQPSAAVRDNALAQSIAQIKKKQIHKQTHEEYDIAFARLERIKKLHANLFSHLAEEKLKLGLPTDTIKRTAQTKRRDDMSDEKLAEQVTIMQKNEYILLADMERLEEELKILQDNKPIST